MCGITGLVSINSEAVIKKMTEKISHRGTDNTGYYSYNNVSLGHKRLSILDLSEKANQPFISACGNYIIVYNGEIYNHIQVRKKLNSKCHFTSNSDTETILYAYIEYGDEFIEMLDGIFSFCILDKNKNLLFIARDSLGVKPLYIYQTQNVFAFSSELKSFLELPYFDRTLNYQSILYYVKYLYCPTDETPFKFVNRLGNGKYIKYNLDDNSLESFLYYKTQFSDKGKAKSKADALNELDKILFETIKQQHQSDVPIGYLLSGGIDSSTIVYYSTQISNKIKAFTIDDNTGLLSEGFISDIKYAKLFAHNFNIELVVSQQENFYEKLDEMIYHLDEPIADTSIISLNQICKEASKQGYKVLMSGLGADDIFSGYRRHLAINYQPYKRILSLVPQALIGKNFKRKINKLNQPINNYYAWLDNKSCMKLFNTEISELITKNSPIEDVFSQNQSYSVLNQMLFVEQNCYLPCNNLLYSDKIAMAHGIEIRVPFLSLNVVNFANQLPDEMKLRGFKTKYILKELMNEKLPKEIIKRKKTGFGYPIRDIIKSDRYGLVEKYLLNDKLLNRNVFNHKEISKLIDDNKNSRIDASYSIWALICIESWFRQFVD